jgi:hypothetical protein
MATPTYDLIDSVTLASTVSSLTFSSITQDYRDLVLVLCPIAASSVAGTTVQFNDDTGGNYSGIGMYGTGSTTARFQSTNLTSVIAADNRVESSVNVAQIMDYSATDKQKTILITKSNAADSAMAGLSRWANSSAITVIKIAAANSFAAGSTFNLYGIAG